MDNFQRKDISNKVRKELVKIAEENEMQLSFSAYRHLSADDYNPAYINQRLKKKLAKRIKNLRNAPRQLEYGMDLINLKALPQIVEAPQLLSIGYCLQVLRKVMQDQANEKQTIEYWL